MLRYGIKFIRNFPHVKIAKGTFRILGICRGRLGWLRDKQDIGKRFGELNFLRTSLVGAWGNFLGVVGGWWSTTWARICIITVSRVTFERLISIVDKSRLQVIYKLKFLILIISIVHGTMYLHTWIFILTIIDFCIRWTAPFILLLCRKTFPRW